MLGENHKNGVDAPDKPDKPHQATQVDLAGPSNPAESHRRPVGWPRTRAEHSAGDAGKRTPAPAGGNKAG